jgi:hypothetical protein
VLFSKIRFRGVALVGAANVQANSYRMAEKTAEAAKNDAYGRRRSEVWSVDNNIGYGFTGCSFASHQN